MRRSRNHSAVARRSGSGPVRCAPFQWRTGRPVVWTATSGSCAQSPPGRVATSARQIATVAARWRERASGERSTPARIAEVTAPSPEREFDTVLVVDFGAQYAQLI